MPPIDFVAYPPTSFPYRDVLLLEQVPLGPRDRVCEVGVGSGATATRLAKLCAHVTGFDVSSPTIESLRYLERRHDNLRLLTADVTDPGAVQAMAGQFTRVVSCDTLEHVADPARYFGAVADLLAPGGEFFVTFPNEPPDLMHGITRFDEPAELRRLLVAAGLGNARLGAARLEERAERIARTLGWRPLRAVRSLVRGRGAQTASGRRAQRPQTFEATSFYRNLHLWRAVSPLVNLYWFGVLRLMTAGGRCFDVDWNFRELPFRHCQVVIVGRKEAGDA